MEDNKKVSCIFTLKTIYKNIKYRQIELVPRYLTSDVHFRFAGQKQSFRNNLVSVCPSKCMTYAESLMIPSRLINSVFDIPSVPIFINDTPGNVLSSDLGISSPIRPTLRTSGDL